MKKFLYGFTLSEILITLGVIGVVSAMTLPVIIKNINNFQYKTAYKKAYSVMSQALLNMVNDDQFIWDGDTVMNANYDENFRLLSNYIKTTKTCFENNANLCWYCDGEAGYYNSSAPNYTGCGKSNYAFVDNSGTAYYMYANQHRTVVIDTNGNKAPNQLGRDRFVLYFLKDNEKRIVKFSPFSDYPNKDRWCPQGYCYYTSWLYGKK